MSRWWFDTFSFALLRRPLVLPSSGPLSPIMEVHLCLANDGAPTDVGTTPFVRSHLTPCSPFCAPSHSEIPSPPLSPPFCDRNAPPTNPSCDPVRLVTPARLAPCETEFTSVEPESLLLSCGDRRFPSLHHFPSLPDGESLPSLEPDDLRSINYSPRFPPGHFLNPAFAQVYMLGDELGSGGYGFVMTALHRRLGSEVAVKFVIKNKVPEQAWVSHDAGKIPMEIMLLQMMNHENIVKCFDVFEDNLFFYIVQELHGSPWRKREKSQSAHLSSPETLTPHSTPLLSPAASEFSVTGSELDTPPQVCSKLSPPNLRLSASTSGDDVLYNVSVPKKHRSVAIDVPNPRYSRRPSHDLFECIEQTKHKRLSERQAQYIMAQVVEAVCHLNSLGICHRDIKDENLIIDKNFKVKLIDFGSATMVDPTQPQPFYNLFFGTTAYAASEVLLKQPYQAPPVEIWTLGVLMSYLLTGMSPFPTERDAIEGRIMLSELPGRKLSHSCLHLMSRCLEPDPFVRADIEEVRRHPWLRGALDGL